MRYVISDLHLGHKNILNFSPNRLGHKSESVEEHDTILETRWRSLIHKKDTVLVLGDVAFTTQALQNFGTWPGYKILIRGNHDVLNEGLYREIFYKIFGVLKKDNMWFSHAPIHPEELRGKPNVHGHTHYKCYPSTHYYNVCVEHNQGYPVDYDKIKGGFYELRS